MDDPKAQPNRAIYLETLRRMTPEQRLAKAFELTDMSREALRAGLRQRFPDATDEELHAIYLERLARCQGKDFKHALETRTQRVNGALEKMRSVAPSVGAPDSGKVIRDLRDATSSGMEDEGTDQDT